LLPSLSSLPLVPLLLPSSHVFVFEYLFASIPYNYKEHSKAVHNTSIALKDLKEKKREKKDKVY
jgi:hypothetical protein